jgi:hypothetical protein
MSKSQIVGASVFSAVVILFLGFVVGQYWSTPKPEQPEQETAQLTTPQEENAEENAEFQEWRRTRARTADPAEAEPIPPAPPTREDKEFAVLTEMVKAGTDNSFLFPMLGIYPRTGKPAFAYEEGEAEKKRLEALKEIELMRFQWQERIRKAKAEAEKAEREAERVQQQAQQQAERRARQQAERSRSR